MKTLTLLRHAKAERDSPDGSDFARSLNARGRATPTRMGKEMRGLGLRFDWSWPARRGAWSRRWKQAGELAPIFEPANL